MGMAATLRHMSIEEFLDSDDLTVPLVAIYREAGID